MDADDDQVVPGGWKRVVLGFLLGILAGALLALVLPRDDGPRRRSLALDPDQPAVGSPTPGDVPPDPTGSRRADQG